MSFEPTRGRSGGFSNNNNNNNNNNTNNNDSNNYPSKNINAVGKKQQTAAPAPKGSDWDLDDKLPRGEWPLVESRHKRVAQDLTELPSGNTTTQAAKVGFKALGAAQSLASNSAHISNAASGLSAGLAKTAVGGVAAAGKGIVAMTGPIGLAVAGTVLKAVDAGVAYRREQRTARHEYNLQSIKVDATYHKDKYWCKELPPRTGGDEMVHDHKYILETILPYIIMQKDKKRVRALESSLQAHKHHLSEEAQKLLKQQYDELPTYLQNAALLAAPHAISALVAGNYLASYIPTLESLFNGLKKTLSGTMGQTRTFYAYVLSRHHVSHHCELTMAIFSELLGPGAPDCRVMNSDECANEIAEKMKSS